MAIEIFIVLLEYDQIEWVPLETLISLCWWGTLGFKKILKRMNINCDLILGTNIGPPEKKRPVQQDD